MKLLKDLVITRKEFQDWNNAVNWGKDGTLYLNTFPDISIGQPIYTEDVGGYSKNLFHVSSVPLEFENKFEFVSTGRNTLLNSQPTSHARLCKPSSRDGMTAILTNNNNINIFRKHRLIGNLDQEQSSLAARSYHCCEWSPDGGFIAVGNENGQVVIFQVNSDNNRNPEFIALNVIDLASESDNDWIIDLSWSRQGILALSSKNTIYWIYDNFTNHKKILDSSRFKIYDMAFVGNNVVVSCCSFIHIISTEDDKTKKTFEVDPTSEFSIIPVSDSVVIFLSNKHCFKINLTTDQPQLVEDDIISPHLERKFKKWNGIWNQFKDYETSMVIYGVALSPDKQSVVVVYEIERVSLKYKILSECQYNLMFIPLKDSWSLSRSGVGLMWYQTYNIYNKMLPDTTNDSNQMSVELDTSIGFDEYLNKIIADDEMTKRMFQNFISQESSIEYFQRSVYRYALDNLAKITNPIDQACVESLANVLKEIAPFQVTNLTIKGDFIEQSFNFSEAKDSNEITSIENNRWRRCGITLLPLITTKVKKCPVSLQRIIDINNDKFNQYGWFTRTLLESFNNISIFSGSEMQ